MARKPTTITTAAAARQLGISMRTLYRLLYDGTLPEPRAVTYGNLKARVWTNADLKRARRILKERNRHYGTLRDLAHRWRLEHGIALDTRIRAEYTGPRAKAQFTAASDLLTPQELAERLKVPVSWIYEQTRKRAVVRGKIAPLPNIRMGKYLRFSWPDVVAWLNSLAAQRV